MRRYAVCYTATTGYLFSTVLSALQARRHTADDTAVIVLVINDGDSAEENAFRSVCKQNDVDMVSVPRSVLRGLHPTYARLFLDEMLPSEVEEILYLDGDTQVVGDISSLVHVDVLAGHAWASRDPMVLIKQVDRGLGVKIDRWWDSSAIPDGVRANYVNAGMLRLARATLPSLRDEVLTRVHDTAQPLHFKDQDAINLSLAGRLQIVSMSWNFPGFLLNTQLVALVPPRIIHFMSDPRPWNAALRPWGADFYEPYRRFAVEYPQVEPYWDRLSGRALLKYVLQQRLKHWTERRVWQSPRSATALAALEVKTTRLG